MKSCLTESIVFHHHYQSVAAKDPLRVFKLPSFDPFCAFQTPRTHSLSPPTRSRSRRRREEFQNTKTVGPRTGWKNKEQDDSSPSPALQEKQEPLPACRSGSGDRNHRVESHAPLFVNEQSCEQTIWGHRSLSVSLSQAGHFHAVDHSSEWCSSLQD